MALSRREFLALAALSLGCRRLRAGGRRRATSTVLSARRIVSLAPPITEILFALGAGDRVVGVSNLCDAPPESQRLPHVGTMVDPNFDAISALRPDAIVAVEGPINVGVIDRLRAQGARTYAHHMESFAELRLALDPLAALGGRPDAGAELRERMDAGLARIRRAVGERTKPRAVMVYNLEPLVVAGHMSWGEEVLLAAGGENAVMNSNRYPLVSVEQVMSYAPEVLVDLTGSPTPIAELWAQHSALPAIANHRVLRFDGPLVRRMGPRVVEAATALARGLHPGLSV